MNINRSNIPSKWESKNGRVVSMSTHHKDMYIVDHPDGTFHTINTSAEIIVEKYPVVIVIKR